jgi:hypothetical protein
MRKRIARMAVDQIWLVAVALIGADRAELLIWGIRDDGMTRPDWPPAPPGSGQSSWTFSTMQPVRLDERRLDRVAAIKPHSAAHFFRV